MDREEALARAIEEAGGPPNVAKELGISREAVHQWKVCPANRVLQLERLLSQLRDQRARKLAEQPITRHELRPDLYPHEADASTDHAAD